MNVDTLGTLQLIWGVLTLIMGGLGGLLMMLSGALLAFSSGDMMIMGIVYVVFGIIVAAISLAIGGAGIRGGRHLKARASMGPAKMAAILFVFTGMIGIIITVLTFMTLGKDEVQAEFAVQ